MNKRRILVVDDEIIIAREIEARITAMGFEVPAIAASGNEAIRLAGELRPDIVIMDIVLKGEIDGIEAAADIRRQFHIPVIYLTAYTDEQTLDRAKVTEPFGYIVKPFSERELKANIEMALYKHDVDVRARKLERWFANAMEEVADAVVVADHDGHITLINQAAESITAWTRDDALGRPVHDVLRIVDRPSGQYITLLDSYKAPLVCLSGDTFLLDKCDACIPVDITASCVRDQWCNPNGIVSVFRDVSGQRSGAFCTLNAEIGVATTQSLTVDAMLQLCCDSIVRNLNAAFARIWTINAVRDTLVLRASAGLYTHINGAHGRIPVGKLNVGLIARERRPYLTNDVQHDHRVSDHDWARQEGLVAFAGYPLIVEHELLGVLAIFARHPLSENVTNTLGAVASTVAVALERKHLEEQLRHSQKMEAVGQLAGGVAHDFNNLLTVVSGCAEELQDLPGLPQEARELVQDIGRAGERAAGLTRQLLAFSRQQIMTPQVLNLNVLLTDFQRMLRRLLREDIELLLDLKPGIPNILADPGQIEQVLVNLAVNARDAMPNGGQLFLETSQSQFEDLVVGLHPEIPPGEYVVLAVTDTGLGMAPEIITHIFEPFYTTKEMGRGTGLGLSTVYGIVRQSGGHITVYSEIGQGTTFRIYLNSTSANTRAPATVQEYVSTRGTETILIVEDEDVVRRLVATVLRRGGYTVLEAADGASAIELVEKLDSFPDLLLTDMVMPKMSGPELARELLARLPGIRVLYMSGYTDSTVLRPTLQPGAAFLKKPLLPGALLSKVRELLDQPKSNR